MNWTQIESKSTALSNDIKTTMDTMSSQQREWSLPDTGSEFKAARAGLDKTEFNVVVCGEVKRGKSTLINAILGRELLPTGVAETTCQVFRISNGPESYKLVFDDGGEEPITAEELVKYGSQVAVAQAAMPLIAGRSLKWIDVQVPAKFLPKGVYLVDTPGLGALYAAHSIITNKYVAQADAVVFVLDSGEPLTVGTETDFLERVYRITPNVIFVQNKIDQLKKDAWQKILKRNKELLTRQFEQDGREIEIYPLSSTNLFDASQESDEENREELLGVSRFEDFKNALEMSMYRVVGWYQSAMALAQSSRYHGQVDNWFAEQKESLSAKPNTRKELQKKKGATKTAFENEWGKNGTKRKEVQTKVEEILKCVKSEASALGDSNVGIHKEFSEEIDRLSSKKGVDEFAKNFGDRLNDAVNQEWQAIMESAAGKIAEELESNKIAYEGEWKQVDVRNAKLKGAGAYDMLRAARIGGKVGGVVGAIALNAAVIICIAFPPAIPVAIIVTPIVATIGFLAGIWRGIIGENARAVERCKTELQTTLKQSMAQFKQNLCHSNFRAGKTKSTVDEFVDTVKKNINDYIETQYSEREAFLAKEIADLGKQADLEGQSLEEAKTVLKKRIAEWKKIGEELQNQTEGMQEIQELLTSPAKEANP